MVFIGLSRNLNSFKLSAPSLCLFWPSVPLVLQSQSNPQFYGSSSTAHFIWIFSLFTQAFPRQVSQVVTGTMFTIVQSERVCWQLCSSCSHCGWPELSRSLSILTNKQPTRQIISFCVAEVCLVYIHDSEMYLSSTDLFALCPGPISFKRASSTHVVL